MASEHSVASSDSAVEQLDLLIVGAGLSGIGAAHQMQAAFPRRTLAILESRDSIGGTWDLFRYPGVRSDSDMHTLGYRFRPWAESTALADGPAILRYIKDTAAQAHLERHIRFRHQVIAADWSSADQRWTVTATRTDETGEEHDVTLTCTFLFLCSGYYSYDSGYTPDFPGRDRFRGEVVHPQFWPADLEYAGKHVVVIGSGATAVTLVPAMAGDAEHVTMLQRSPTYIVALPGQDPLAQRLHRHLPSRWVYPIVRWKNILLMMASYQLSRRRPEAMKRLLRKAQVPLLPPDYDIDTHLTPGYNPWDQRLCVVPDGDLFQAIRSGSASIVTDTIDTFTESGIRLHSGAEIAADIVVTATGLNLAVMGGLTLSVDGEVLDLTRTMAYKSMMLSDVPNFAFAMGYTNASWTLKVDLTYQYLIRLFRFMDAGGYASCAPTNDDSSVTETPFLDFAAGYVLRSLDQFPKQGSRAPWRLRMNYLLDIATLRLGKVDDGVMRFERAGSSTPALQRR